VSHSGQRTAQSDGTRKAVAIWAVALADEELTAALALLDGVRHFCAAALEVLAQALQIGQAGLMAEAKGELLVSRRATCHSRT